MNLSSLLSSLVVASGGEANLKLPNLGLERFLGGAISGSALLALGLVVSAAGLAFGLQISARLKNLPVHRSMLEISELIYETAKTYLMTQFKFIGVLWAFIAVIIVFYYGVLSEGFGPGKVLTILAFSLVGILGSSGVAWFGIRVNTYANSRTAFASLRGKPFPTYAIPLQAGMSIGTMLISVELLIMLFILLFMGDIAGPCFIGFAIGESLGASALRIAGGIFTKIADIGSDLMKIVFKIKEDDARNPGVIADCTGDNAGDSVGPSADGFETYGVTGVALISFILLAVAPASIQTQLLVWIFAMRIMMVIASVGSYWVNDALARNRFAGADKMDFEQPLTQLVWLTSGVSIILTYLVSYLLIPSLNGDTTLWWKLSTIITCGTAAGAIVPEMVKVFTSTNSRHVREVVTASKEGGASLNVLAGLTAGNFSAFWLGLVMAILMGIAYQVSRTTGFDAIMAAPAVFAFGLVAFGFLGMGPVTIAVDSYGPVTDNAQSVYELSLIENIKGIKAEVQKDFGFEPNFEKGKEFLEENDGAGNTFKATAKPVLIGTAVVGATTMIFSIIVTIAKMQAGGHGGNGSLAELSALLAGVSGKFGILQPMFLLGLLLGGSII
jgi:K(+)-stimulated pyrophosphate-energized sodium pump